MKNITLKKEESSVYSTFHLFEIFSGGFFIVMPVAKETDQVTQVEHEIKKKSIDDINAQKEACHTEYEDSQEGDKNENASTGDVGAISQSGDHC